MIAKSNLLNPSQFSFLGNRRLLYFGGFAVVLVVALAVLASLLFLRQQTENRIIANSQAIVTSLEVVFVSEINTIDAALIVAEDEIERALAQGEPNKQLINDRIDALMTRLPYIDVIRASNERGDLIYGPGIPASPPNISERDYFRELRDHPNGRLLVSKLMIGNIDQKWTWPFVRRINKPDDSFGGVVYARINIPDIITLFSQVNQNTAGIIALRDTDLRLIARQVDSRQPVAIGEKKVSARFLEEFKNNPQQGTYQVSAKDSIDGVNRIISYRLNPKYGFLISDGIDRDAALADWHGWVWIAAAGVVIFMLAIFLILRLIDKSWRHEERDLAIQHEADLKVAESEKRFHTMILKNKVVILEVDAESGGIIDANDAACQFYGWSHSQLCAMNITDLNALDPEKVAQEYHAAAKEQHNDFIFSHRLASGETRTVEVHSTPVEIHGKTILVSIIHDITKRRVAEKALASQNANLKALLETASDGIHILDASGKLLQYSHSFATMLGYTVEEMQGLNVWDWDAGIPREQIVDGIQKLMKNPEVFQTRHRRKDGSIIDVEINAKGIEVDGKDYLYASSRDITERKHLEEKISHMAYYDMLTELPNRRLLKDRLGQALASNKRSGHYGALLFIDLDNFKPLNDIHGHEAGDLLLIEVGRRIKSYVREMDTIARIGGDEFVALIGQLEGDEVRSVTEAGMIAEKIRLALAEPYQIAINDGKQSQSTFEHHCTASIGVAVFSGKAKDPEMILSMADAAMYEAKEAGRNQVKLNSSVI